MSLSKQEVIDVLDAIQDPASGQGLAQSGIVQHVAACDGYVTVTLRGEPDERRRDRLKRMIEATVTSAGGEALRQLTIEFAPESQQASEPDHAHPPKRGGAESEQAGAKALPGVRHMIAVGAGKGGVGKSTVAGNLAVALARTGHAVGLLDGDIYGPSIPTLMGLGSAETSVHENRLQPFLVHGVKTMTIGKLVDPEKPLIWRGPMAHGAFKQLVEQTQWGELDYLIIDLPPGTGDVPLTMAQLLALRGAIIVCTPQRVAQDDAVRAVRMFQQLNVEVLGVVENMSYFVGDDGVEYDLFGRGGAEQMAQRLGLPYLGAIPIYMALRSNSDAGTPTANFEGSAKLRESLEKLSKRVEDEVALATLREGSGGPVLSVR